MHRGLAAAIVLLTLAAFSPVSRNGFVRFDDTQFVTWNPTVLRGLTWPGAVWALTSLDNGNWIPLARLGHMANVQLFGLHAAGHHLAALAVHAAAAAVLFLALARLTGSAWPAAFAAGLFAVHPLRVESVAWVAELRDVLSGLFFALALLLHQRWAARRVPRDAALLLLAGALGLASKPMVVTLPLVLLLLDIWPLGRWRGEGPWPLVREKLPLLALAVAAGAIATVAQGRTAAMGSLAEYPLLLRLGNAAVSAALYLGKLFWPLRLSPFYPYEGGTLSTAAVAGALLLLAAATAGAFLARRSRPWLGVGWAWFLLVLAPVSGVVQVGFQGMADRYTYLPSIGLALALGFEAWTRFRTPRARAAGAGAAGALLLACALLTARQAGFWRDTRTLFAHALALAPGNWLAHLKLAEVDRQERAPADALPHLEAAAAGAPANFYVRTLLGVTYGELGRDADALRELQLAVRLGPGWVDARHNLGVVLANAGRLEESAAELRAELRLEPGSVRALEVLGPVLLLLGRLDEADRAAADWLAAAPGSAGARELQERIRAARPPR
jgi:tetratricopeptide (TPR) repeat protein